MSLTSGRALPGFSCLQLGVMSFLQQNCVCAIISTFVVRCLNIKGTTPVLFPERRTYPFNTKSKVSLMLVSHCPEVDTRWSYECGIFNFA